MNQSGLKLTKSMGEAMQAMDEKHRGKFVDILWSYQQEGKEYKGNDTLLKVAFALAKAEIDRSNLNSQNGRLGGLKTAANKQRIIAVEVQRPVPCKTGMEILSKALGGK